MKDSNKLGWVVAALLGGILVGSGFQEGGLKLGVVDITSVVEKSKYGIEGQRDFGAMKASREGLLEYVNTNRIITVERAAELKDLYLKPNKSAAEEAKLKTIQAEIQQNETKNKELTLKGSLTPEEKVMAQEFAQRAQTMDGLAQRWYQEFMGDLQTWADKRKQTSLQRARQAIQTTAKAQGFTIVLEVGIAPYGANNITDAALKAMDEIKD